MPEILENIKTKYQLECLESNEKFLDTGFVICYKQRSKPNEIATMELVGDVEGKDVVIIDDIIDSGFAWGAGRTISGASRSKQSTAGRFVRFTGLDT